ncbi:MAG: SPW repeat protein [Caldilineaceae bacterium]|nr:SPW repeat protein [Caldilineaceae bacterium]MCB0182895.1 SPW repeat protein [Caldilineaceae bacterium]
MDRAMIARVVNVLLGIWLMAAPNLLGYGTPASTNDRIVGPLIITFATVAMWEATRSVRWANLPLGLWLLLAPWLLAYSSTALINSMTVGLVVALLSLVHGEISGRYGGGWRSLVQSN